MNDRIVDADWSLWDVEGLGLLLLTQARADVLVQPVELDLGGEEPVAVSKSPSGGRTVLRGEGGHPELFETVLVNHLSIFEIDRADASRITVAGVSPFAAATLRMGGQP